MNTNRLRVVSLKRVLSLQRGITVKRVISLKRLTSLNRFISLERVTSLKRVISLKFCLSHERRLEMVLLVSRGFAVRGARLKKVLLMGDGLVVGSVV